MNTKRLLIGCVAILALSLGAYEMMSRRSKNPEYTGMTKRQAMSEVVANSTASVWTNQTQIGQIVAERPQTARILELVGIDYCCGGQMTLEDAAAAQKVDASQLLSALMVVGMPTTEGEHRDWQKAEMSELIEHIVSTHHVWLRRELPPLTETTETVRRVHGNSHPELDDIAATLGRIREAVLPHLDEEEQHLFPALRELAKGKPSANIHQQLAAMRTDHDSLGEDLHLMRELTNGFVVPADACAKYREMLTGLAALERDMHQHVHLENNVVLPRAQRLLANEDQD